MAVAMFNEADFSSQNNQTPIELPAFEPDTAMGRVLIRSRAQTIRWYAGSRLALAAVATVFVAAAGGMFFALVVPAKGRPSTPVARSVPQQTLTTPPPVSTTPPPVPTTSTRVLTTTPVPTTVPPVPVPASSTTVPVTPSTQLSPPAGSDTYAIAVSCPAPTYLSVTGTGNGGNILTVSGPLGQRTASGNPAVLGFSAPAGTYQMSDTASSQPGLSWSAQGPSCSTV